MSHFWNAIHLNDPVASSTRNAFDPPTLDGLHDKMTWGGGSSNPTGVMEFTAVAPGTNTHHQVLHAKRKPMCPDDIPVPTKKLLTEEAMAAHLNNLHITGDTGKDSMSNYTINMNQWDLERKLRTAQKITVCNEILELDKDRRDAILPEVLLNRISKPSNALVLWQPPPSLTTLFNPQSPPSKPETRSRATANKRRGSGNQNQEETEGEGMDI